MAVVISPDLVLTDTESGGGTINADNPLIGFKTRVTTGNVSATTAVTGSPARNVANPSTNLRWQAEALSPAEDEHLTFDLQTAELVDYLAIARHNLGSEEIPVSVEVEDTDTSPPTWTEVIPETLLGNDDPALFRFDPQGITQIRLRMQPGNEAPFVAVVYIGKLLVVQRRLYVGHTPITYGRETRQTSGRSESGDFLGRIVLSEKRKTSVTFDELMPQWYRDNIEPFLAVAQDTPFFWAWRPDSYPREVGYCWITNDPVPNNDRENGMMSVSIDLAGIA